MMISPADAVYIPRCFSAGNLLPQNKFCPECEQVFLSTLDAETHHGVIRLPNGEFSIIIGCEGYHLVRFDD